MPKWTSDQLAAIETRGGTLLVAAAAGSGKTAVLVERVLRRLLEGADINRFLLVTYTNAAAAEMRAKIAEALGKAIAERPGDSGLRRQLFLLHHAQITTVHALCLRLVREQAAMLGLSPDFSLADEAESRILQQEAMEDTLEALYAEAGEGFAALTDLLTAGRDDSRLSQVILELFAKTRAHPDPDVYLENTRIHLGELSADYAEVLLCQARDAVAYGISLLSLALDQMTDESAFADTYLPVFLADKAHAEEWLTHLNQKDWDGAVDYAKSLSFDRLKAVRDFEDKAFLEYLKSLRNEWKKLAESICEKMLFVTAAQATEDTARNAPALSALLHAVQLFSKAFQEEKRRRRLLDFNDLEHFTVRLLYRNGQPSALAHEIASRFDEILVDEYQDTNAVQDAIFTALSQNEENLFFVGDVKQSIYGFRLANPHIFLEKYLAFRDVSDAAEGEPRRVVLGRNFRSREQILDTVNYLFSEVMSERVGDLTYTEREALYLGATYPDRQNDRFCTEFLFLDTADKEEETAKIELEARMVALRIRALIDEQFPITEKDGFVRPVRPEDIAILLRSPTGRAAVYRSALEAVGVTAHTDEKSGLLETSEVQTLVSLLSVIDNPRQDVELVGVLYSPLFAFSEQDLADIRLVDKTLPYYDALRLAGGTCPKAAAFLKQLDDLRTFSADQPVYRLIWEIFDRTEALGLYGSLPGGEQRQKNLLTFFERARSFEGQGHRGLFRFMRMLRGMMETGQDFQMVNAEGEGAVRIMSIHKSKGLEFPVVILAECAGQFNESDLKAPVLVHPNLGVGAKCRDWERGVQYNTLERQALAVAMRRESISEQMRVLYVALTRAREKLIVTASLSNLSGAVQKCAVYAAMPRIPVFAMGEARTYLPWMLTPLLRHPHADSLRALAGTAIPLCANAPQEITVQCFSIEQIETAQPFVHEEQVKDVALPPVPAKFRYPYEFLETMPAKITATGLKHTFQAAEAAENTFLPPRETVFRRPSFKQEEGLTSAERGTAHHLFLQFARYEGLHTAEGVQREVARLTEAKILSVQQGKAIDAEVIVRFFTSDLYEELFVGTVIRREFKFSVLAPTARYYSEASVTPEESVLLQGVIDCLVESSEGFIILDFKTDRVTAQTIEERAQAYRGQMDAYRYAVETIFEKPVERLILYFFAAGRFVSLPI